MEHGSTESRVTAKGSSRSFRPARSAAIATGVVLFLFAFRPFGLEVHSVAEVLVLLGVAPVNFLIMLGVHYLPLRPGPPRTAMALCCLLIGNTVYLSLWSQNAAPFRTGLAVALVVGLAATVVFLWNRGRIPEQDLETRSIDTSYGDKVITLSGQSEQEFLQLEADELLFISADGNYVNVHYRSGAGLEKSMLRSSLAGLAAQLPGNLLVQCHRSHYANLSAARRIVRSRGRTLIEFDGGAQVPVSRKFRQHVVKALSG